MKGELGAFSLEEPRNSGVETTSIISFFNCTDARVRHKYAFYTGFLCLSVCAHMLSNTLLLTFTAIPVVRWDIRTKHRERMPAQKPHALHRRYDHSQGIAGGCTSWGDHSFGS